MKWALAVVLLAGCDPCANRIDDSVLRDCVSAARSAGIDNDGALADFIESCVTYRERNLERQLKVRYVELQECEARLDKLEGDAENARPYCEECVSTCCRKICDGEPANPVLTNCRWDCEE